MLKWDMVPMEIESQYCAFYSDSERFPAGTLEFDCGLLCVPSSRVAPTHGYTRIGTK
jgi:hypothetical protein